MFRKNSGLNKRLFKMTGNFSWLKKAAAEAKSNKDVVITLPTVSEFVAFLNKEASGSAIEEDEVQAALNKAVIAGLDSFYHENLDFASQAFLDWKYADVKNSLDRKLSVFDSDDLEVVRKVALKGVPPQVAKIIKDDEKLQDAIHYVLTVAYLHSYVDMVVKNPIVAAFNMVMVANGKDLPLSLTPKTGKIALAAKPKTREIPDQADDGSEPKAESVAFKVTSARGPRLSDYIRSLKIVRASVLERLQKSKSPALKVNYITISANIEHLENVAEAWKNMVKNDSYKDMMAGEAYMMDDPPIGDLAKSSMDIDRIAAFLPSGLIDSYQLSKEDIKVKRWDGTELAAKKSEDVSTDEIRSLISDSLTFLNDVVSSSSASEGTGRILASITEIIKDLGDLADLGKNIQTDSWKRGREVAYSAISRATSLVYDLAKMSKPKFDLGVMSALYERAKKLPAQAPALNFIPSAANIYNNYLPAIASRSNYHSSIYKNILGDYEEKVRMLSFSPSIPEGPVGIKVVSALNKLGFGLSTAMMAEAYAEIRKEGLARVQAMIESITDRDNITDAQISALGARTGDDFNALIPSLESSLSQKATQAGGEWDSAVFKEVCYLIWDDIPRFSGNIIPPESADGTWASSLSAYMDPKTYNSYYSTNFSSKYVYNPKKVKLEGQGAAIDALDLMKTDYFYSQYEQHEKKADVWASNYEGVGDSQRSLALKASMIKQQYDSILNSNVIAEIDLVLPRGGLVVPKSIAEAEEEKKAKRRKEYVSNIQKFLSNHSSLDSIADALQQSGSDLSPESLMTHIGVELIEAYEPELVLYLANKFSKSRVKGVSIGPSNDERGEDDELLESGGTADSRLKYSDYYSGRDDKSLTDARGFVDQFKQRLKFNTRVTTQLHPYTPGGAIADIYYMGSDARMAALPNQETIDKRERDIELYKTDPDVLLSYLKKRLADAYGKDIYDGNELLVSKVLAKSRISGSKNPKDKYEFMEAVGAFADPAWSTRTKADKKNYKYFGDAPDTAYDNFQRAFSNVGQIAANENNYDTVFSAYRKFFDDKKQAVLSIKDKSGRSIWKDYIVPYKVEAHQETNNPFEGKMEELVKVRNSALLDGESAQVEQELAQEEEIALRDTSIPSLLITDRKTALVAIDSIDESVLSNMDKSMVKGIVIDLVKKNPKIFSQGNDFVDRLIEKIAGDRSISNREEVAAYFKASFSIGVAQAKVVERAVTMSIQEEQEQNRGVELIELHQNGLYLYSASVPTGFSNISFIKQKVEYRIMQISDWVDRYRFLDSQFMFADYISNIRVIESKVSGSIENAERQFSAISPADRKLFGIPTFGTYIANYKAYLDSASEIQAEESLPDFTEFLELKADYLSNYPSIAERIDENISDFGEFSITLYKNMKALVSIKEKLQEAADEFDVRLKEVEEYERKNALIGPDVEKWRESLKQSVEMHKSQIMGGTLPEAIKEPVKEEAPPAVEPVKEEPIEPEVAVQPEQLKTDIPVQPPVEIGVGEEQVSPLIEKGDDLLRALYDNVRPYLETGVSGGGQISDNMEQLGFQLSGIRPDQYVDTTPEKLEVAISLLSKIHNDILSSPSNAAVYFSNSGIARVVDSLKNGGGISVDLKVSEQPDGIPLTTNEPINSIDPVDQEVDEVDQGQDTMLDEAPVDEKTQGVPLAIPDEITIEEPEITRNGPFGRSFPGTEEDIPEISNDEIEDVPEISSDEIEDVPAIPEVKKTVPAPVFEAPTKPAPVAPAPIEFGPSIDTTKLSSAVDALALKAKEVEGALDLSSKEIDDLESLLSGAVDTTGAKAVIENTKKFIEFLSSLKGSDFDSQKSVDSLVDRIILPLVAKQPKDFSLFFMADKFPGVLQAIKDRFVFGKKAKLNQVLKKVNSGFKISIKEDDEGYTF